MTSSTSAARAAGSGALPAVMASASWAALAALLLTGAQALGLVVAVLLVAVATAVVTVVGFVRRRSHGRPDPALVVGLVSPMIALAAMTPMFALGGALVFGVFCLAVAVEMAVLAVISARSGRHA